MASNYRPEVQPYPSSAPPRPPRRLQNSPWVFIGAGATLVGYFISLVLMIVIGSHRVDVFSPPFAGFGFVVSILSVLRGWRPRQLALVTFALNITYWLYFALITASL